MIFFSQATIKDWFLTQPVTAPCTAVPHPLGEATALLIEKVAPDYH